MPAVPVAVPILWERCEGWGYVRGAMQLVPVAMMMMMTTTTTTTATMLSMVGVVWCGSLRVKGIAFNKEF